jgi:hypothetical protein
MPERYLTGSAIVTLTVYDEDGASAATNFSVTITNTWFYVSPSSGYAGGGSALTVAGAGFASSQLYSCHFRHAEIAVSSPGTVRNSRQVSCATPAWPIESKVAEFELRQDGKPLKRSAEGDLLAKRVMDTAKSQVKMKICLVRVSFMAMCLSIRQV